MVEANFLSAEEPTEEEKILAWQPLTFARFVRQKSGMRLVKERKRQEKHLLNLAKFGYPDTRKYKEIIKARNKMVK